MKIRYNVYESIQEVEEGTPLFKGTLEELISWFEAQDNVNGFVWSRSGSDGISDINSLIQKIQENN